MPGETVVLVPLGDGTESCGLGTPLTPAESNGLLSNMGPLISLVVTRFEDLLNLPGMVPGIDEVQQIATTGGTPPATKNYTLAFNGSPPSTKLTVNSTALNVEAALAALDTIGAGNVTVSGASPNYQVAFVGALGNAPQPLITADTTNFGGTVTITELTNGAVPGGEVKASSRTDSFGQLLVQLTDASNTQWVYRVIPAVRLDAPDVVFLGRLVSGVRNDLPVPAAREPLTVNVPKWGKFPGGKFSGPSIYPGAQLTVYDKDTPRTGTVHADGGFTWNDE